RREIRAGGADFGVFVQAEIRTGIEQHFGEAVSRSAKPVAVAHLGAERGAPFFAIFAVGAQDVGFAFDTVDETGSGGSQVLGVCRRAQAEREQKRRERYK